MKGKKLFYFLAIGAAIALFFTGCAASGKWESDIVDDMQSEVTAGDYDEESGGLEIFFEQIEAGENYIRTIWQNVKLVPKDDLEAPSFDAARIRIASHAKEKAGRGKFLLDVEMKGELAFCESFNNPAAKYGEPFVDGYWGIGLGYGLPGSGLPGFLMLDPDSRWTVYETAVWGYKTKSGDKADLGTLLIGVVYYKNKPPRPLKEVLAEKGINVGDFVSANKWGYCPELADK